MVFVASLVSFDHTGACRITSKVVEGLHAFNDAANKHGLYTVLLHVAGVC